MSLRKTTVFSRFLGVSDFSNIRNSLNAFLQKHSGCDFDWHRTSEGMIIGHPKKMSFVEFMCTFLNRPIWVYQEIVLILTFPIWMCLLPIVLMLDWTLGKFGASPKYKG